MAIKEAHQKNAIKPAEFDRVSKIIYNSFSLDRNITDVSDILKREKFLIFFSDFFNQLINNQILDSKSKLEFIDFIDKLNLQKERLELEKGKLNLPDIQAAGKRIQKKAQSAFKTKR